jgi:hypothetical protein
MRQECIVLFALGLITLSVPIFRPESSRGEPQQWGLSQRAVYVPASQWPYYGRYILGRDTMPVLHSRGSVIGRRRAPACLNPSDTTARITLAMPVNVAHGKLWLYKPLLYLLTRYLFALHPISPATFPGHWLVGRPIQVETRRLRKRMACVWLTTLW